MQQEIQNFNDGFKILKDQLKTFEGQNTERFRNVEARLVSMEQALHELRTGTRPRTERFGIGSPLSDPVNAQTHEPNPSTPTSGFAQPYVCDNGQVINPVRAHHFT